MQAARRPEATSHWKKASRPRPQNIFCFTIAVRREHFMYVVLCTHGKSSIFPSLFLSNFKLSRFPSKFFCWHSECRNKINWLFNKPGHFSACEPWRTFDTEYANQTFGARIGRINPSQLQNRTSKSRNYWRMFTARPIIIKMSSTLCALCNLRVTKSSLLCLQIPPVGPRMKFMRSESAGKTSTHHAPRAKPSHPAKPHYENQVHAIEISH